MMSGTSTLIITGQHYNHFQDFVAKLLQNENSYKTQSKAKDSEPKYS